MKIATQNQAFFPENILEKFRYIKAMGFDGYEIDGRLLVNNLDDVKAAIKETGLPVTTACGGYDGWSVVSMDYSKSLAFSKRWRKWAVKASWCLPHGECLPSVCHR
jgi:sugar phosphate isomerase/epimerase